MESKWSDLPADLVACISDRLEDPADISRVRSVCRSWRFKTQPFKLSPYFPLRFPWCLDPHQPLCQYPDCKYLVVKAVYLVRPVDPNSKAAPWMVSVRESDAGEPLLRHAMTDDSLPGLLRPLDLSGWSLTQLAISHGFKFTATSSNFCSRPCEGCRNVIRTNVVLGEAMAVYNVYYPAGLCAVRSAASRILIPINKVDDFVNFNDSIYAVDSSGEVYLLDSTRLQMIQLNCHCGVNYPDPEEFRKRFVVSNGELYLVFKWCAEFPRRAPHKCYVYKLGIDAADNGYTLEKVDNLGGRVFFITRDCSFSVSARDLGLAPPLAGNCVLVSKAAFRLCYCVEGVASFNVYHIGEFPASNVDALKLYAALFATPSSCIGTKRIFTNRSTSTSTSPPNH